MIYEAHAAVFNLTVFVGGMIAAGVPGARELFGAWLGARSLPESPSSPESVSSAESSI